MHHATRIQTKTRENTLFWSYANSCAEKLAILVYRCAHYQMVRLGYWCVLYLEFLGIDAPRIFRYHFLR